MFFYVFERNSSRYIKIYQLKEGLWFHNFKKELYISIEKYIIGKNRMVFFSLIG